MSYIRVGAIQDLSNKAGSASAAVPEIDMSDEPEIIPPPSSRPSASDFSAQRRPTPKKSAAFAIGRDYLPGGARFEAAKTTKKAGRGAAPSGTAFGMSTTALLVLAVGGVGVYLLTRKKGGGAAPAPAGA